MRKIVADEILNDKVKYNKEFLGKDMEPDAYAKWIQVPNSWGGLPELQILAKHFQKVICVMNINDDKIYKFGD